MSEWRDTTLGEEIQLAYGKALPAHSRQPGSVRVFGSNGQVGTHTESLIDGPGIIVGRKGSVGAVVYSEDAFWPIDTTYYVVNPNDHSWRYLDYLLSNSGLTGLNSHSAVPGLNREDVYSIGVSMPRRPVQDSIAAVLDSVAAAIALEETGASRSVELKRAAMRNLFASGLRGEGQKETEIGPVPESWKVVSLGDVREWLQYGTSVHCSMEPRRHAVLRIPNVELGRVNSSDLKYCDLTDDEAEKYRLKNGDLLFIRTNGVLERLGSCAVYNGQPDGALFASYLIRARLSAGVVPHYVAYFYGSTLGTAQVAGRATPAADGKYNLNTGTIDSLPLPLPPTVEEQQEIVDVLEAIDHKIDLHRRRRDVLELLLGALTRQLLSGELTLDQLDLTALPEIPTVAQEVTA